MQNYVDIRPICPYDCPYMEHVSHATRGRFEFRIRPEAKALIERAAQLAQQPVGDFVRSAAEERAERIIQEQDTTTVPADFFNALLEALDQPAQANEALRKSAKRLASAVTTR